MEAGGQPFIEVGDATVDERDVAALRAIDEHGSMNRAASALGRSYARIQQRVAELEESVGPLVERTRGGQDGGGSTLTDGARDLLARYERLDAEFTWLARTEESVFPGTVVDRDGSLGRIETAAGTIRGIVHGEREAVQVSVRSDAVALTTPAETPGPDETSVRNRLSGTVSTVDGQGKLVRVEIDVGAESPLWTLVTDASRERLGLAPGEPVVASFKATATRAVPDE